MVSSRRCGVAARGSMTRASLRSSVVTETVTQASRIAAISARMSMSRWISAPLVTIVTGWRKSRSTSRIERVMLELPLGRLIGIGVAAERDRPAGIALLAQLGREQRRRLRLVEDAALEIEAGRQAEIGVARPRVAIDAAVLAAAIGVDRAVEADIGRIVAGDDRARRIDLKPRRRAASARARRRARPSRRRTRPAPRVSKRPLALLTAPRPLRGMGEAGISMPPIWHDR